MNPRLTYRASAVAGATPVRQAILLYEQAIEDLRRASAACRAGDVEERTRQMNHAILVLGCLQSSLDRNRGGDVAAHLERFYNTVRTSLLEAQCLQSAPAIESQISCLMQVHEAWCEVERAQRASGNVAETSALETTQIQAEDDVRASAEWKA